MQQLGEARKPAPAPPSAPSAPKPPEARELQKLHVGPIHSTVAGRTDHLPVHVPSGSYIIPADIISSMGEGNSMAGFKVAKRVFSGVPYSGEGMPYRQNGGPYGAELPKKAGGGATGGVACLLAGGEYAVAPHEVQYHGGGDIKAGHLALDDFVKQYRAKSIKTLKGLPGPKRD